MRGVVIWRGRSTRWTVLWGGAGRLAGRIRCEFLQKPKCRRDAVDSAGFERQSGARGCDGFAE